MGMCGWITSFLTEFESLDSIPILHREGRSPFAFQATGDHSYNHRDTKTKNLAIIGEVFCIFIDFFCRQWYHKYRIN